MKDRRNENGVVTGKNCMLVKRFLKKGTPWGIFFDELIFLSYFCGK